MDYAEIPYYFYFRQAEAMAYASTLFRETNTTGEEILLRTGYHQATYFGLLPQRNMEHHLRCIGNNGLTAITVTQRDWQLVRAVRLQTRKQKSPEDKPTGLSFRGHIIFVSFDYKRTFRINPCCASCVPDGREWSCAYVCSWE